MSPSGPTDMGQLRKRRCVVVRPVYSDRCISDDLVRLFQLPPFLVCTGLHFTFREYEANTQLSQPVAVHDI
jgi:hypothetical protein